MSCIGVVMGHKRIDIFREDHIGFGIRWRFGFGCRLSLSFAFPFFTVIIRLGDEI